MKLKNIFILSAFNLLLFAACEDLDTIPGGDIVTSEQKEEIIGADPTKAEAGVNSIFSCFSTYMPNYSAFGNISRHNDFGYPTIMIATDMNGYDVVADDNGYNWAGYSMDYTDRSITSYECQMVWNDMYSIIYNSNNVLATIDSTSTNSTLMFYRAQALGVRAFSYWVLAQLYQFNYADHKTDPCVPLITDQNRDDAGLNGSSRATVEAVYSQILSDINTAVELLTEAENDGVARKDKRYISLAVAYGLRARVNLVMENWAEAADDADSAIQYSDASCAGIEAVGKPTFSSSSETNWMWGIVIAETDDVVSSWIVNWISHVGSLNYGYANYSGGRQINKALYNSIPETDVRKGWWLNENLTSSNLTAEQQAWMTRYGYVAYTNVKFGPYNDVTGTTTNANDLPLMRIEEMHLIKAEAEAMSGNVSGGASTLTDFVTSYRDPEYSFSASSNTDVQEEVFHQRRIELWGEGLNWFDIMRLNKPVDRRGGGYPNATMVFNISAGSDILLWRIPESEIQANKALSESDNNPSASVPSPVADI